MCPENHHRIGSLQDPISEKLMTLLVLYKSTNKMSYKSNFKELCTVALQIFLKLKKKAIKKNISYSGLSFKK